MGLFKGIGYWFLTHAFFFCQCESFAENWSGELNLVHEPQFEMYQRLFPPAPFGSAPYRPFSTFTLGENIEDIRVQIFPHAGRFVEPMGREASFTRLSLVAKSGVCKVYKAPSTVPYNRKEFLDPTSESTWPAPIRSAARLDFSTTTLPFSQWIECASGAELVRQGQKSATYRASFYVRKQSLPGVGVVLQVIALMPFENYLKGVVPSEMPATWAKEALAAQAVAARSYAAKQVLNSRQAVAHFDVDDTVLFQAYRGEAGRQVTTDEAVEQSKGILLIHKGQVATAYFSSDAGGYTESAKNVWPGAIVESEYCVDKKELLEPLSETRWQVSFSSATLTQKLRNAGLLQRGSAAVVVKVEVLSRFSSGRVEKFRLHLSNGQTLAVVATSVRMALALRSTLVDKLTKSSNGLITFSGFGFGHGAGMSQRGAHRLATEKGFDFRQILEFYYSGIELQTLPGGAP